MIKVPSQTADDQILIDNLKDASNLSVFLEHEVVEVEGSSRVEGIAIRDLDWPPIGGE